MIQGPIVLYPHFQRYHGQKSFPVASEISTFSDNSNMAAPNDPSPNKLFKLQPLSDHLFKKFQEVYVPAHNISIEESLLL